MAMLLGNMMPAQREKKKKKKKKVDQPPLFHAAALFPLSASAPVQLLLLIKVPTYLHACAYTDAERRSVARMTTPIEIESQQKEAASSTSYTRYSYCYACLDQH